MSPTRRLRAAAGALAAGGLLLATPAPGLATGRAGPTGVVPDTADCELRLQPPEVPIREAAVLVSARASRDPGNLRGVTFPGESGVRVLNAAPAPNHDEVVARMALDTSGAAPGRWPVLLRGEEGSCRGEIRVRRGEG